ncbi:MAG: toxin TcdB middle/N-terminal domain-containing protein [Pseudomonadota bacterium]
MTFIRLALICITSLGIANTAVAVDYGRTAGSFDVSTSGASTYSIPIWTPPGPNGVQPSIALAYNSQSGNSLAGVGWSLAAVSSIERCPRTIGQDGTAAEIALTGSDRFCLGGSRLRLSTGTYGVAGSVYFTELADYSRITAYGTLGAGPDHFIVEAKSGLRYEYGNGANAQVNLGGSVLRWMLNKVYDRNNNAYAVTYLPVVGFSVPDVISWTPTSQGASTYSYEAKFNYSNTRTDTDSYLGNVAGFAVANHYRLENIQIKSAGIVKRKYRLAYDTSSNTSRSRLTSFKECADDAETNCLLPLTFNYQAGQGGVTLGAASPPAGSSTNLIKGRYDLNGDGKDDVVYWGGTVWNALLSTNGGFAGPYSTGISSASVLVDNFLPTGRDAITTVVSGTLWTYRWGDATSAFVGYNTGIASAMPAASLDFTGDGLADLVYFTAGQTSLTVRYNTSTGSGNPSFGNAFATAALTGNKIYGGVFNFGYNGMGLPRADINGDRRQDLNVLIVTTGMGGGSTYATILLGSSGGFDLPPQSQWILSGAPVLPALNFNGDRCADRLVSGTIKISACSGVAASSVPVPANPTMLMDWDGDGKTDLLVDVAGTFGVYKSTGAGFSSLISTSIPSCTTCFAIDQDGDGLDDFIKVNGTSPFSYWTHTAGGSVPTFATNIPDLLSLVTDGFGITTSPSYVSTAWSNYDKGATTSYPLVELDGGKVVVSQVSTSDGTGGTFIKQYFYVGARGNATRGEFAGFQRFDETDTRNGLIAREYFEQFFPIAGLVSQSELMQPNGTTTISRTAYTNTFVTLDSTANNQRYFLYSPASTSTQYEVGGTWNAALLRTVSAMNFFDSQGGTRYRQIITTTEPASGANGSLAGGSWTFDSLLAPAYLLNDTTNWCLGRPQQVQNSNSSNLTFGANITRTRNLTWDPVKCRPTQFIDESGSGTLQVTTDLVYDGFGNTSSTTVTGTGMDPRVSSAVYSDSTHPTGQFPLSVTQSVSSTFNQTSAVVWNYDLGVPYTATDPNNLTIIWQYDAFGRRIREDRPDTTYATWDYLSCPTCDSRVRLSIDNNVRTAAGATFERSIVYLDQFDRSIFERRLRLDGGYNMSRRNFDSLGRVVNEYFPFNDAGSSVGYATIGYDLLSRPTSISRPISDSNSTAQTTNIFYEGLTTRTGDAQSKSSYQVSNAAGQLSRSKDNDGNYQGFDYDAFGNLKRVFDAAGNILQSSTYNLRGDLTQRVDMDMGTWNFTPDALGETISQTDANSQTTTFSFDRLGRLTSRTEAEGTSSWTWGISSSAKNVGRLSRVADAGYSEDYTYDAVGRPEVVPRFWTAFAADISGIPREHRLIFAAFPGTNYRCEIDGMKNRQ